MKFLIIGLIRIYRRFLGPMLRVLSGGHGFCRFQPTCSRYFLEAVERYGSVRGSWMGICRIFRCHPWGDSGYDPVPTDEGADDSPSQH